MSETSQELAPGGEKTSISLNYIKSNFFRAIHVDGVFGGLSPSGFIHASVFSERLPIPQIVTQEVNEDGSLGNIVDRSGRSGVIREVEADLVMSKETAQVVRDWLSRLISAHENSEKAQKETE